MRPTPDEDRIARLYRAFNARDFERCVAMMAPDVSWPDEMEDRRIEGPAAVYAYFTDATAPLRARYEPISNFVPAPGQVDVLARQIIVSATDGSLWSSTRVRHRFQLRDGAVTRLESDQDYASKTFPGIEALLHRLHRAIEAGDLETVAACYAPHARFQDTLEGGEVVGETALRAHFAHLFQTVRVQLSLLDYALEADDRVCARMQVEARSPNGGLWQDGRITVWYRVEAGLIVEQDVDDSGEEPS